ncbi:unnamed protein product, partial [marine sediment metagenome]
MPNASIKPMVYPEDENLTSIIWIDSENKHVI